MSLKYKQVDHDRIRSLRAELNVIRAEIDRTLATPSKELSPLQKSFKLDGLDQYESFLIMKLALKKGIIQYSLN
jgi:hypothetical protein